MLTSMKTTVKEIKAQINRLRTDTDPKFARDLGAIADSLDNLVDGASKGGTARAKKLSKKRRKEIATLAANKRWAK